MSEDFFLEDIFASGGSLSRTIEGFEEREGQLEMAKLISEAYSDNRVAVIEAGTGIGKSFAYLAPALKAAAQAESERTVIATSTKNLQKQLADKDIPLISSAMGVKVNHVIMMGRSNYLCMKRFSDNEAFRSLLAQDPESREAKLLAWARSTETGLIDEYRDRLPESVLRSDITSDQELCLGRKCPFIDRCFYFKSRKSAESASIIVTNHHLLFSDAAQRMENDEDYSENAIIPAFSRLVIDECHNMDRNATSLFTRCFSSYDLSFALRKLLFVKHSVKLLNIIQCIAEEAGQSEKADEIIRRLDTVSSKAEELNQYLLTLMRLRNEVLITEENFPRLAAFSDGARMLADTMVSCCDMAHFILQKLDRDKADEMRVRTFESGFRSLDMLANVLKDFTSPSFKKDEVRYLKKFRAGRGEIVELSIAPLSIASILNEAIFSKLPTVVCCSATLKVGEGFEYFKKQVGLENYNVLSGQFLSPFDYGHNLLLLSAMDGAQYRNSDEGAYISSIVPRIRSAIEASAGGALVLFTSYKMMVDVYSALEGELPYKMLIQSQGISRSQLFAEFKEDADSCLFATQSFWEGVDAPGSTLRLVIITKLPFPQLKEPLFEARAAKLDAEMPGSSFPSLSMPEMIMKLKQGVGRLIRTASDKGVVYILDSRMNKWRSYILSQLPPAYAPDEVEESSVPRLIEAFVPLDD